MKEGLGPSTAFDGAEELTTAITYAAVSGFFSSRFLIPAAAKIFCQSGGMLLISKPFSLSHPMCDSCRNPDGAEMSVELLAAEEAAKLRDELREKRLWNDVISEARFDSFLPPIGPIV